MPDHKDNVIREEHHSGDDHASGRIERDYGGGVTHTTTYVTDNDSGQSLRASYNTDSNGDRSEAHFHANDRKS